MKEYTKKQKITAYAVLALIIIAQIIYTTFAYVYKKEGYHSDEIWSYGLANSYYKPFIYIRPGVFIDDMTPDDIINLNEWKSGEEFKNYITVQEGEQFSYVSVYDNQTLDHHPPLYYFLLHTVCSFFPDTFSWWFGYSLNIIFLIVTQIFLYKLSYTVLKGGSIYKPLIVCGMYAFGIGALSTFIFVRMYSMLTMMTVMHIYYQMRLIKYPDESLKKLLPPVLLTAFAGFMTEYLFIPAAGIATACVCIITLCRKKIKRMFITGLSMTAVLALFVVLYPACIKQITGYSLPTKLTWYEQTKRFLSFITYSNCGFSISIMKSDFGTYSVVAVCAILAIGLPLCFLFRKDEWFKSFVRNVKQKGIYVFKKVLPEADLCLISLLLIILAHAMTNAKLTNIMRMGSASMRYAMPVFPLAVLCFISIFNYIFLWLPKIRKYSECALTVLSVGVLVYMHITFRCYFYFGQPDKTGDLYDTVSGSRCIIVLSDMDGWSITCFSQFVMDTKETFFTNQGTAYENTLSDVFELKPNEVMYAVLPAKEDIDEEKNMTEEDKQNAEALQSILESQQQNEASPEELEEQLKNAPNVSNVECIYNIKVQGTTYGVYQIS